MIAFETSSSPFFEANKRYCDSMVAFLEPEGADFTGICNSYGYRVEARFKKDGLAFQVLFVKHQTTQNGVIIPKDANEYAGTEVRISGISNAYRVRLGKSRLKRLFTSKKHKDLLPSPFYLFTNHPSEYVVQGSLVPFIKEQKVDVFRLKDGKALCRVHKPVQNPLPLIENLENVVRSIS